MFLAGAGACRPRAQGPLPRHAAVFETGVRYQATTPALRRGLGRARMAGQPPAPAAALAGILLFSGSLYLLS